MFITIIFFFLSNILVANKINIIKEMNAQDLHVNTFQKAVKGKICMYTGEMI